MSDITALITGASRGIGRAIALKLAERGYNLELVCRNNINMLNDFASELTEKYGVTCHTYAGNIGDYEFVTELFNHIDKLDVLVNNAGISHFGLITDMTPEEWRNIMSINLDSVFYTSKHAAKLMLKEHSGHIINISSVWGNVGASLETAYSASKGAVNSFTKAMAKELAPSGISVNAIACGIIDTDMNGHLSPDELQAVTNEIPADRMGTPDEIGQMVLSIIDAPGYMTGQIITVDGGWT